MHSQRLNQLGSGRAPFLEKIMLLSVVKRQEDFSRTPRQPWEGCD